MPECGVVSIYSENGVEWTYRCDLEAGHATEANVIAADGTQVAVLVPTEHHYVLDDGQTPPAEPEPEPEA